MPAARSDVHLGRASSDVRDAWLALLLFPIAVLGFFLVEDGLVSALGHHAGTTTPFWVSAAAFVPALVAFVVPVHVATVFAKRAAAAGDPRGWVPARVLVAVTLVFVVLIVGQALLAVILGLG